MKFYTDYFWVCEGWENTRLETGKCYAFFKRGEVRSQRISECNANIVKYTKQIVGQQIYRHLEDVKVIKKRKPQKSMETNVHPNEGPISLLFFAKIQRGGKTGMISDFETTIPVVIAGSHFKSCKLQWAASWSPKFQQHLNFPEFSGIQPFW